MTDFSQAANRPHLPQFSFKPHFWSQADGLAMHYIDEGQGDPVILVHGNPSWSYLWRHLISALSPNFRCLAFDHVGMGWSARPKDGEYGFRLAQRVDDLTGLVEHWGLTKPVHLIMHDWGGPIGLAWAGLNPERVASLTLMNTGVRIPADYRMPLKLALFKHFTSLGGLLAQKYNGFVWGTARCGVVNPLSEEARQGFLAPYQNPEDRLAIARFVEDIPLDENHPSYSLLNETDRRLETVLSPKPMRLVWGLRDFVFNRRIWEDWQRRRPDIQALVLPEASHYLLEDEPDQITTYVGDFLLSPGAQK